MPLKKIAYLIGAGATHAEIMNLEESPSETFIRKYGLKKEVVNLTTFVVKLATTDHEQNN